MSAIRHVAVIGAGTMGHGIAYVSALNGYRVTLGDADPATLETGLARIRAAFEAAIERRKCTVEQRDDALRRLMTAQALPDVVVGADLVIEAVPERLDLKRHVLAETERHVRPETIIASNTSSLSISSIADALERRDRVVGLHFFNPVPAMRLVEIVRGSDTSDATIAAGRDFATSLGKTAIVVRDSPGFATSRLGVVLGLEAIRMLEQGVASAEDIDRALELGYNHPVGPLRLTDIVGLDVRLAIAEHLYETLKVETYRPPALLVRMVREGKLGKKSGEGFYRWEVES